MSKKSFEEIREKVTRKFEPLSKIELRFLNEDGLLVYDVYDVLDDCFCFASTLEEYIEEVRRNIDDLLKPVWYRSIEQAEINKKIAEKLRLFVRVNIEKELWESIPAFADRKEK